MIPTPTAGMGWQTEGRIDSEDVDALAAATNFAFATAGSVAASPTGDEEFWRA
jgi:hypothetical protein